MNNNYNYRYMQGPHAFKPYYYQRINPIYKGNNMPKISFSQILNSTSKTLGVINQAIPVFYQIKPIWNNAKTMLKIAKGINSKDEVINNKSNSNILKNKTQNINQTKSNAPVFYK